MCIRNRRTEQNHVQWKLYVTVPNDLIDKIKFDVDQDFCVFSFLFKRGRDVETMEQTVYFLKTFELNISQISVFTLRKRIKQLLDQLYILTENGYGINKIIKQKVEKFKFASSAKNMLDMAHTKNLILRTSELYCSTTTPRAIISNKSLIENKSEAYQKKVIGFMMNNEACVVNMLT